MNEKTRLHISYTDTVRWPFRAHPNYQRVYAPWGAFGPRYQIRSLEEYERTNQKVNGYIFFAALLGCGGDFLSRHVAPGLELIALLLALGSIVLTLYLAAKQLPVAEARPSFWRALSITGRETKLIWLWMGHLLFLGLCGMVLSDPVHKIGWGHHAAAICCAAFALLFSVMIFFHLTRPRH